MKQVLFLAVLLVFTQGQMVEIRRVWQTIADGTQAIEGFLVGLGESQTEAKGIEACAKDASVIVQDVRVALDDFSGFNYLGGLQSLGNTVNVFPSLLTDCSQGFSTLDDIIAKLFDPNLWWYVLQNSISKGPSLIGAVNNAITAFDQAEYYNFGYDIGSGLYAFFH